MLYMDRRYALLSPKDDIKYCRPLLFSSQGKANIFLKKLHTRHFKYSLGNHLKQATHCNLFITLQGISEALHVLCYTSIHKSKFWNSLAFWPCFSKHHLCIRYLIQDDKETFKPCITNQFRVMLKQLSLTITDKDPLVKVTIAVAITSFLVQAALLPFSRRKTV